VTEDNWHYVVAALGHSRASGSQGLMGLRLSAGSPQRHILGSNQLNYLVDFVMLNLDSQGQTGGYQPTVVNAHRSKIED
jgi:hypothetical protein